MRIKSIKIKNFRCFESIYLSPREGINVFVGENSAGKSSVFIAVSKLFKHISGEQDAFTEADLRFGKLGKGMEITCKLELEKKERFEVLNVLVPTQTSQTEQFEIYSKIEVVLKEVEAIFQWQWNRRISYIKIGPIYVLDNHLSNDSKESGAVSDSRALFKKMRELNKSIEETLSMQELWGLKNVKQNVAGVLSKYIRSFAEFRGRPCAQDRGPVLESFQGGDTAMALLNLKNHRNIKQQKKYRAICNEIKNFFPYVSIEAVETEPGSGVADIQFIDKASEYPVELNNVGAGVAELLTLITNLVARENYVIILEEPELHLHPHAKRRLQKLIKITSTSNQVFVITHDAFFIDQENLNALIRFSISDKGTQTAHMKGKISQRDAGQLRTAMKNIKKREMVFARALLLVEDESQENIIEGFADTLDNDLDSNGISVINVDGSDSFKPYIKLAETLKIPYICLRDLDWGQNKPAEVYFALGSELEDYLRGAGLGSLMDEASRSVGNNKPRVAKYVGECATVNAIPDIFSKLITDVIRIAEASVTN